MAEAGWEPAPGGTGHSCHLLTFPFPGYEPALLHPPHTHSGLTLTLCSCPFVGPVTNENPLIPSSPPGPQSNISRLPEAPCHHLLSVEVTLAHVTGDKCQKLL